jgi:hypothetical protein
MGSKTFSLKPMHSVSRSGLQTHFLSEQANY